MISPATGNSTIKISNEVDIDYCSSDDEIDFDLGSSDEDGEDGDDETNNDENSDDIIIVSIVQIGRIESKSCFSILMQLNLLWHNLLQIEE
jgi:hypothetical protein